MEVAKFLGCDGEIEEDLGSGDGEIEGTTEIAETTETLVTETWAVPRAVAETTVDERIVNCMKNADARDIVNQGYYVRVS